MANASTAHVSRTRTHPTARLLAWRTAAAVPVVLIATALTFWMLRLSGVSPVTVMIGQGKVTEDVRQALANQYGFDKPLVVQYWDWLTGVFRGDLGVDYVSRQSVADLIAQRLPVTIGLVVIALALGVAGGIGAGMLAALHRNTWVDRTVTVLALFFAVVPAFLIGVGFLITLAQAAPQLSFVGAYSTFGEYVQRILLPALILSLHLIGIIAKVTRRSLIEQLQSEYHTGLVARGLPRRLVIAHLFRGALAPVLTIIAILVGALIGETVLVETVFSLPGLSGLLTQGVKAHNYPVVQAVVLILTIIFIVCNIITDALYRVIDPRSGAQDTARKGR